MSNDYTNFGIDDVEVFDVEIDEQNSTATIYVRETVEEVHEFDETVDLEDKTVRHSHLWKCEKTEDGDVETPLAADEDVEEIVETYPVDFSGDEENQVVNLEVSKSELEAAVANTESVSYTVDGYAVYACQLVQFDDDGEVEIRDEVEMCDGTVVDVDVIEQAEVETSTEKQVATDGGQVEGEDEDQDREDEEPEKVLVVDREKLAETIVENARQAESRDIEMRVCWKSGWSGVQETTIDWVDASLSVDNKRRVRPVVFSNNEVYIATESEVLRNYAEEHDIDYDSTMDIWEQADEDELEDWLETMYDITQDYIQIRGLVEDIDELRKRTPYDYLEDVDEVRFIDSSDD